MSCPYGVTLPHKLQHSRAQLPYQDASILHSQRQPQQPCPNIPLQQMDQGLVPPMGEQMQRSLSSGAHSHTQLILLRVHSSSELLQRMHVEVMILSPEPSSASWDSARCENKD